jgi:hypothetical protein
MDRRGAKACFSAVELLKVWREVKLAVLDDFER